MFGEDEIVKDHKARADIIGNIVLICFTIILSRLWYLQIYKGKVLFRYSLENRLRKENVRAPRGMIFSRNNKILIHNTPRFDVIITPQYLKNKEEVVKKLGIILDMKKGEIDKILRKNRRQASYRAITIKKNISRREVAVIETEGPKLPGISVKTFISRNYTDKEVGAHLLGYISEISRHQLPKYRKRDSFNYRLGDFIGQAGIEENFDLTLRGHDGYEFMEVDASGRMKRQLGSDNIFEGIENLAAIPGKNIRLTIDEDLQKVAFDLLEEKVGSAVAIDVNTGEVLAMVSRPSFDPSKFSKGLTADYWNSLINNDRNPLRARTIQEHYPPGSTFKIITAIAGLEEGVIQENTEINCAGRVRVGRRYKHCWRRWGHGKLDVYGAIRESCDVFFYKIASQLDIDVIAKYARLFGLGSKTGITIPRETSGLVPTKEWKMKRNGDVWRAGETLSCAIGQSYMLTTPIQLAMAYAAVANGGTLYRPYVVKEIFSNKGEIIEKGEPKVVTKLEFDPNHFKILQEGLHQVTNKRKGTAWWYRGSGIDMSGKTGTSQVIKISNLPGKCEKQPYRFRDHGLFVGYAPADNPKIVVASVIEHGCHGASAAAPVVRGVITTYMKKYFPELRKEILAKERQEYLRRKRLEEKKESGGGEE